MAQASFQSAMHQVAVAKGALARAEEDLAKTTIASPLTGTVSKLNSQLGERVVGTAMMTGTEVMVVSDLEEMEARVDIGEIDVVLIEAGQNARLEVDAFRDRKFSGTVTEIANSSKTAGQPATGGGGGGQQQEATKFEVKIRMNEKELFRPGMSVTAEIETRSRTNVLAVPIASVTTRLPPEAKEAAKSAEKLDRRKDSSVDDPQAARADKVPKPIEQVFVVEGENVKGVPVKRGISDEIEQIIEPAVSIADCPTVQLGLDLQYPAFGHHGGVVQLVGVHRRQPPGLPSASAANLLTPFAMCAAFPPSDYYGVSAPPGPVSRRCACPAAALAARARAEPDGSHVHCRSIDERGVQLCPCGLATVTPQTFTVASLPTTQASSGVTKTRSRALMCAASTPYPPDLRRGLRLRGFMTLVPLVRLLVSLTRPGPSGSTRPS